MGRRGESADVPENSIHIARRAKLHFWRFQLGSTLLGLASKSLDKELDFSGAREPTRKGNLLDYLRRLKL